MHQTLRSLMFAAYEREEEERQKAFADAQRIVSGTQIGLANVKDELDDECDLELEPRFDVKPIRRPVPVEPEPQSETDRLDIPDPSLQSRPVTRSTVRQQVVEDDEYVDEIVSDNEELFNAHEEKLKIQGDSMRTDDIAISEPSEVIVYNCRTQLRTVVAFSEYFLNGGGVGVVASSTHSHTRDPGIECLINIV
ncbi:unnamed protein product [Haemonchus placei]|uniref:Uncharacterized protein n=1 Tax=Haemonchus placei TaxID=6290 RepID=A0A0N4VWM6_HAEPC|nr:unnamed protein product [Haemonchus placei]